MEPIQLLSSIKKMRLSFIIKLDDKDSTDKPIF